MPDRLGRSDIRTQRTRGRAIPVLSPEKKRAQADLRSTHPGGRNRLIRRGFRLSAENKGSPAIDL